MKRLVFVFFALASIIPATLLAQEPSPSDGVAVPDRSITTQSDSASIEVNPAGLGFLQGAEASYGFFLPTSDYMGVVPTGHSFNLGLGGPGGGFGFGAQWIHNPSLGADRATYQKYSVGTAIAVPRRFSIGGAVNFFSSRTDQRLNELRTVDLGAQWRANRHFGVGLMARDVTPAFLDEDEALPLRLGLGFVFRFFDGRFVIDSEFQSVLGSDILAYQPRLSIEPVSGIRLFGNGLLSIPINQGELSFDGFSVGAEFSLGSLGMQGASVQGIGTGDEGFASTGFASRFYIGTPQRRAIFEPGGRWVRFRLDEGISEQATVRLFGPSERPFLGLINDLHAVAADDRIAGVFLDIGSFSLGYAQLWELHQAMERLHQAGKESIAFVRIPSTRAVYAAAAAQEVWMLPTTPYSPTGLQAEFVSYAGLLDRAGIEAEFVRIGDYKSAPESWVMPGPSDPAIEQTSEYLDAIYSELTERIATSTQRGQDAQRGLDAEELRAIIDETPLLPAEALDRGLIHALVYRDELDARLEERIGAGRTLEDGYTRFEIADERWGGRSEIAVVYVDGMIIDGESGATPFGGAITGAESLNRTLRQLSEDNSVKAVVVRINSPGGSAVGSDLIYRELRHLATTKPVVASMGNIAASGGYYVAAGADEIFATPVTLTGSIGIFAGKFSVETLSQRLGINLETETRGERAGALSLWRPWTETERQGIVETIEYLYQLFIQQIARTRPLSAEEVDAVARGRVWTGAAAEQARLVDTVGGLADALRRAEELAGLQPGQAVYVDRTGAGGSRLSPALAQEALAMLRHLGMRSPEEIAVPNGDIPAMFKGLESSLLLPLYFESGEALFMPPFAISIK